MLKPVPAATCGQSLGLAGGPARTVTPGAGTPGANRGCAGGRPLVRWGMRVLLLGGTRFIGRRILTELVARGDEVLLLHRGETEPADLPPCRHLHVARATSRPSRATSQSFRPEVIIDTLAMSRADVDAVLPYLPDAQLIVLSSMDVYQAFWHVLDGSEGEPVPLNESSPPAPDAVPLRRRTRRTRRLREARRRTVLSGAWRHASCVSR